MTVCNLSELETSKAANASFLHRFGHGVERQGRDNFSFESTATFISKYYDVVGVYNVFCSFLLVPP